MNEALLIYVARGEEDLGALTIEFATECLHRGVLRPDDLAWTEGLGEWTTLADLLGVEGELPRLSESAPANRPVRKVNRGAVMV